tara:strand:- start:317 stop:1036 length:720 start_codon:yes stop_codon:yes gene_type:complete
MQKPKKSLSQNFITDRNICKKILTLTKINNKIVLEIGPGYGFMTDLILQQRPKKLILIEKDVHLVKYLKNKYKEINNILIIEKDILKFKIDKYKNLIIISNLPYNVSSKIILHLFSFNKNILEMIFMIQKEVALKFDYNLTKMNKYKFMTKIVSSYSRFFDVSPKVFFPKPKVISSVVKFKMKNENINFYKANMFSKLIFKNVRKKISNNVQIKNNYDLLNKRVNELSINDLLNVYNSF